ncbi:MAG: hypothetical protein HGA85_02240 [Nanoarchaeota archaeon]|nr:hypothetical protein [Nanoarchaeota archaeon]
MQLSGLSDNELETLLHDPSSHIWGTTWWSRNIAGFIELEKRMSRFDDKVHVSLIGPGLDDINYLRIDRKPCMSKWSWDYPLLLNVVERESRKHHFDYDLNVIDLNPIILEALKRQDSFPLPVGAGTGYLDPAGADLFFRRLATLYTHQRVEASSPKMNMYTVPCEMRGKTVFQERDMQEGRLPESHVTIALNCIPYCDDTRKASENIANALLPGGLLLSDSEHFHYRGDLFPFPGTKHLKGCALYMKAD